jgi:3-hydroxybutyrate dehydrogenase
MRILITGGCGGIGLALAQHFAEQQHHVILADLHLAQAALHAQNLTNQGFSASSVALDLASQPSIDSMIAEIGPIDVLINNAGLQHVARLDEFPEQKWQLLLQVMLTGPAMLTKALLPGMRERNFGRVINIGSIHALVASPFKSAYVAAKHGLLGFSKVVALENADFDFTINTICPAYVRTPLVDAQIAAQCKEHKLSEQQVIEQIMLAPMPQKAFIGVDEIAETALFLTQKATRHMTAQTLVLDGGWTAR